MLTSIKSSTTCHNQARLELRQSSSSRFRTRVVIRTRFLVFVLGCSGTKTDPVLFGFVVYEFVFMHSVNVKSDTFLYVGSDVFV